MNNEENYICEYCEKSSLRTLKNGVFICAHCGQFTKPLKRNRINQGGLN